MDQTQMKGDFKNIKGKLQQTWSKLTDDDFLAMEGKANQWAGVIQKRYGIAKEDAERQVNEFMQKNQLDPSNTMDAVAQQSQEIWQGMTEQMETLSEHIESYVKQNPMVSLAIAGVAGACLGALLKRD